MGRHRKIDSDLYLTEREIEVIEHIFRNVIPSKEIARAMVISDRTARWHIASILAKTGARCITEVVLMATGYVNSPVLNMPQKLNCIETVSQ